MPAWSRSSRLPAWMKRRKKKRKRKKKKKTQTQKGTTAHWLRELLKLLTSVNFPEEGDPYHYNPRHFTKDPEYKWSGERMKRFKSEIPAPDVNYFNAPGDQPPHLGMRGGYAKERDAGWTLVHAIDPGAD